MSRAALLAASLLVPACATPGGPGHLDTTVVQAATSYQGAAEIELVTDAGGAVRKISLKHHDEGRVPEAVRRLAAEKLPGKVKAYELEVHAEGGTVHEVEVETPDRGDCELSATEAGTLLYVECHLKPADLPPAIAQAVAARFPGGEVTEAETVTGPGRDEVRVDVKVGDATHELRLRSDGSLLEQRLALPGKVAIQR